MSSALSESLDPTDVADLMAEHLARALGVEQCAISYWDRPTTGPLARLLPAAPLETIADFDMAGFPTTLRVLEDGACGASTPRTRPPTRTR